MGFGGGWLGLGCLVICKQLFLLVITGYWVWLVVWCFGFVAGVFVLVWVWVGWCNIDLGLGGCSLVLGFVS